MALPRIRIVLANWFWATACVCGMALGGEIDSGLAVGQKASPLDVKDCTGPAAGKTLCYFCRYGYRPTVAIYVRETSPEVIQLIKRTDAAVEQHRSERLAAFVIYTGADSADLEQQLRDLSRTEGLRHTPLTILREPQQQLQEKYAIAAEAAVTVLLWNETRVRDRLAFDSLEIPADVIESFGERIAAMVK